MKKQEWMTAVVVKCKGCGHSIRFRIQGVVGDCLDRACHICVNHTSVTLRANGEVTAKYQDGTTAEILTYDGIWRKRE